MSELELVVLKILTYVMVFGCAVIPFLVLLIVLYWVMVGSKRPPNMNRLEAKVRRLEAKRDIRGLIRAMSGMAQTNAIAALVEIGSPAVELLIAALQNEDYQVRGGAAKALGRIGDKEAIEPLIPVLKDSFERVQHEAVWALDSLGWKPKTSAEKTAYWSAKPRPVSVQVIAKYRGGLGEPYCSEECYAQAARYPLLQIETGGVCGICGNPVFTSVHSGKNYGVVPYEGGILVVCQNCTLRARERFRTYNKCCMCQKSISV